MNFITLEPEQFRKFASKYPDKSFYQTPEIANVRAENGWIPYYFGVEENGKIKAASLVVAKPTFLGKSIYYVPGGPLIDYEDESLTTFFFKNLKSYAKSHNSRNVFGAGTLSSFLTAAVDKVWQIKTLADIQSADALLSVYLVSRK